MVADLVAAAERWERNNPNEYAEHIESHLIVVNVEETP